MFERGVRIIFKKIYTPAINLSELFPEPSSQYLNRFKVIRAFPSLNRFFLLRLKVFILKAVMRLKHEGLDKCESLTKHGSVWFNDPAGKNG